MRTNSALPLLALPLMALLTACEPAAPEPVETPAPTPTAVGLRTLVATGLGEMVLGPRIVGPQGPEVVGTLSFEGQEIAQITSFVACPAPAENAAPAEECDPEFEPEGAIFTYVHRVTPGEGASGPLLSFRTSRPATGFANTLGFDRDEAKAALGDDYAIGVQIDNGALIWRIEAGDGWDAGEEITFFWQSTLPPEGPAEAYEVETSLGRAAGTGPFPPAEVIEETGDTAPTEGARD